MLAIELNSEVFSDFEPDPGDYQDFDIDLSCIAIDEVIINFSIMEPAIYITDEHIEKWSVSDLSGYKPSGDDIIGFKTPQGVRLYMKVKNDKNEELSDYAFSLISTALNIDLHDIVHEVTKKQRSQMIWPGIIFTFRRTHPVNKKYKKDHILNAANFELENQSFAIDLY